MIHKTKKEEGKKHINMPLRWEFRIFRPDLRQISAFSGMFRPYRSSADTTLYGRYGPIPAESAQFGANRSRFGANQAASARIEPSRPESEKKKTQTWHRRVGNRVGRRVPRRAASYAGAAPSQPRPCFLDHHQQKEVKEFINYIKI